MENKFINDITELLKGTDFNKAMNNALNKIQNKITIRELGIILWSSFNETRFCAYSQYVEDNKCLICDYYNIDEDDHDIDVYSELSLTKLYDVADDFDLYSNKIIDDYISDNIDRVKKVVVDVENINLDNSKNINYYY